DRRPGPLAAARRFGAGDGDGRPAGAGWRDPGADGCVRGVLRRGRPRGGGAGPARRLGRFGVLGPALVGLRGADALGAVEQLRAGRGAAVPADGRDTAAGGAVRPPLPRAQHLAQPDARRTAAHQHRVLRRVLRDLRQLGGDGGHHGIRRAALLHRHGLQPTHGPRLARGRRGARQPDPARHHLHRVRAHHRDLSGRALHGGAAAGAAGDGAVRAGDPPARAGAADGAPGGRAARAEAAGAGGPAADGGADGAGARLHLRRLRHADGGGGARRGRRGAVR
ncbi:MAG: TRAP-type C4-dicarboxylate transport system, large permease component, partial [uncultured Acetobacteraceae bacterium]